MVEIRSILCPIDFSDYSRRALDHAIAIARRYESTITALHVFSPGPAAVYAPGVGGFEPITLTRADRDQLSAEMERFVESESAPGIPVRKTIREGDVAKEILAQASEMKSDLLIMGTHGRSGFERLVLGSVTEKVLRKAGCPVLTVPRRHPDAVPAAPVLFRRILCPVDFSDCSMQALHYAMSLAQEADAHLTVVYVAADELEATPDMYGAIILNDRESLADVRRLRDDEVRRRLKGAIPAAVEAYCRIETMVSHGNPSREIVRMAGEQQTDLIVMGVQGRGAVDLLFFGSTTNHVVREATCPVLTVRRPWQVDEEASG